MSRTVGPPLVETPPNLASEERRGECGVLRGVGSVKLATEGK